MKKRSPLVWLIPLILLLLIIPFIVPSALPGAYAAGKKIPMVLDDLPEYEPVTLENTNPGEVPTEEIDWGKRGAKRIKVLYPPHWKGLLTNEEGKNRGYLDGTISVKIEERVIKNTKVFFTASQNLSDRSNTRMKLSRPT